MINGENESEINNYQNISDLNDLFQRTYEFDIFKYVSRGLIKSQQNYETQLTELKLDNLKTKKEILALKKEIDLLKGNTNQINPENRNESNNIDKDLQNLTYELDKKKRYNKTFEKLYNNQGGYNNINFNEESQSNKNNKGQKGLSSDIITDDIINPDIIKENKNNDEKDAENSNESMIKMTNTYINELVNENKFKKKAEHKSHFGKTMYQNNINIENINSELIYIKSKLDDIDKDINQLKHRNNQTISELTNNIKNNIFDNIIKSKEESRKELNSLVEEINQKINQLNEKTNKMGEKNEENEKLMNRTNSLNNSFLGRLEIVKAKFVDYVSKEDFEKYKNSLDNKLDIENKEIAIDISTMKKTINILKSEILNFSNDTSDHDAIITLKQKQDSTNILLEKIIELQKESKEKGKKDINIDTSKFVDIEIFNEYQKNQAKIIDKIKRDNIDLGRELNEIKMVDLNNKVSLRDLKNLEDDLLIKLEDMFNKIKEKFVEKKSLDKFLRLIEFKTKQMLEDFKEELKPGKNWLLAKKPVGHLCASCETYLGEIVKTPNEKSFPWKKYISKASGDNKNIKLNVGFSKIIQLANNGEKEREKEKEKEKEKYVSLRVSRTNIFNGRNNSSISKKREENEDLNNINMSHNTSKINKLNLENNNSFQAEEYETDIFNGPLPQIKKKMINSNKLDEKKLLRHSIKSLKDMKGQYEVGEKSDFFIMMNAERRKNNKIDFGPKITKIVKKYNTNRSSENQLINESKKSIEG